MTMRDMFGDFAVPLHRAHYSVLGPYLLKDGQRVLLIASAEDFGPSSEADELRTRICNLLNAAVPAR